MEKYGFVYIWYDRFRKMYYIGCHWGIINDGYVCSNNRMRDAYRRRPDDFKRRVITKVYTNKLDLLDEEYKWLLKIKPEELGTKYYNLRQHKWGHWANDPDKKLTVGQKISKAQTGKIRGPHTQATLEKLSIAHLGKKLSPDHIEKIRLSRIGAKFSPEHRENIRKAGLGRYHTKESKELMSELAKKRTGKLNSQYGTCWTNDGTTNKKVKKENLDDYLKLGYYKGRIKWKRNKI